MKITDLSLKEKVLQTSVVRVDNETFYPEKVGGIYLGGSVIDDLGNFEGVKTKETSIKYKEHADIPMLICSDFEMGCGVCIPGLTELPMLMGLGAANDERLAYDYGKATAMEAVSIGANWNFAPVCDLSIHPRNLTNVRCVSDEEELTIKIVRQVIKGMQENGLAACLKHFPGDGLDWRDSHMLTTSNTLSLKEWWKISGRVFMEMIREGAYSVMIGHNNFPAYQKEVFENGFKLPASLSKEVITNLLKGEMNFQGVVVTDALAMGGCLGYYESKERTEIESFKAGADMMLWPTENYVNNMMEAVENGYVSMERLDDAVTRILNMKEKLGLFHETSYVQELTHKEKIFVKTVQKEASEKSLTLIRDEAGFFPLTPEKKQRIAVVPIARFAPFFKLGEHLASELREKGLDVSYFGTEEGITEKETEDYDVIIYALFGRPHRPIGFLDYVGKEAVKVAAHNQYAQKKSMIVSFCSPYYERQYYERALTYVNAYSSNTSVVEAFVRAATGEIEFSGASPVKL